MRRLEDHPEAAANLRQLLGEERWEQLVSPPFKLRIPSKRHVRCYWVITAKGRVRRYNPNDLCQHTDDQAQPMCRSLAWGFVRGVPLADRILAMLLWIIADERAFGEGDFPPAQSTRGRLAAWDAIFDGQREEL